MRFQLLGQVHVLIEAMAVKLTHQAITAQTCPYIDVRHFNLLVRKIELQLAVGCGLSTQCKMILLWNKNLRWSTITPAPLYHGGDMDLHVC